MGRLHLQCWCRHSLSPGDWPRGRAGLRGPRWLTSGRGGRLRLLGGGCPGLLWLWWGPARVGKLQFPGSTGLRSRGQKPRVDIFWSGEVPGMSVLWIGVRPWLEEVRGDTRVVSTASCAPPHHNGSPLAITSVLLSSCRSMCSRLRSLSRVLLVTRAPASRQTRAAARSKTTPLPRETPAWAHAARLSPSGSRM